MMKKLLFVFYVSFFLISCGSLPQKKAINYTSKTMELGVVGEKRASIRETNYQVMGNPVYSQKVKVAVSINPFGKEVYKYYLKNSTQNQLSNSVNYIDSISPKPTYVDISIEDRVAIVEAINAQEGIYNYLKSATKASIVSSLRVVVNKEVHDKLLEAEAFYLQTDVHKKQWLLLYKNQKEIGKIDFNKTNVFGYDVAYFCWELSENKKNKITILEDKQRRCAKDISKNKERIQEKEIKKYLKF